MGFSRHSSQSLGTWEASQARSSSRKASSSVVKFKSINKTPLLRCAPTPRGFLWSRDLFSSEKSITLREAAAPSSHRRCGIAIALPVHPHELRRSSEFEKPIGSPSVWIKPRKRIAAWESEIALFLERVKRAWVPAWMKFEKRWRGRNYCLL